MLIQQTFEGILIGAVEEVSKKSGNSYYNLSVELNDSTANIGCTKEVYDSYKSGKFQKYSVQNFLTEFNTNFQSYRIVDIVPTFDKKK